MTDVKKKELKKKDERTRNWTFIVYPESAPEDWRTILDELHVPWVESPLHDRDTNPDGEIKKAHWHIALFFSSKKSISQIEEIQKLINAAKPQKIENAKGMIRYFIHMDNPEKYQYSKDDLICHGGADISKYLTNTGGEKLKILSEIQDWINESECVEFADLAEYARTERFDDWYGIIVNQSTIFLTHYIRSRRHSAENKKTKKKDLFNGKNLSVLKIKDFKKVADEIISSGMPKTLEKERLSILLENMEERYGEPLKSSENGKMSVSELNDLERARIEYKKIKDLRDKNGKRN